MATTLTLALSGIANDHPVLVHGTGTLDQGRLVLNLRVDASPMDLDPVLLVLAGVDPLLAIAAGAIPAPTDEPLVVRGRADIHGEGDARLGSVEVRGVLAAADGGLSLAVNVGPAWAALEVGERVVEVEEGAVLVRGATILAERVVRTSRGRELRVIATASISAGSSARSTLREYAVRQTELTRRAKTVELDFSIEKLPRTR